MLWQKGCYYCFDRSFTVNNVQKETFCFILEATFVQMSDRALKHPSTLITLCRNRKHYVTNQR